ncbi:M50 family metallopeptidase [Bailinhaonella thermotolerans]|uniref:M50 family peptidase n=1 Tax=Bailinhaonella thermotolerans TaxID=1070861 RepID=A0A3A4BS01_9ACTN|nr:M50 family metallopeptidase [Bailinhaonella thermotolerans]RJL34106.1 M50 family peptidase [Bailinhaonella thermotolerans]
MTRYSFVNSPGPGGNLGDDLGDVWERVLGTQPDPPWQVVLATAAAALAIVAYRPAWRVARNVVTIAHEGGHALVAVLTGRTLTGIRLHSDTSGVTVSKGRPTGPGMVATAFSGYVTPSALGFLGAWLLAAGHVTALLWIMMALLLAMLVMIRNVFGIVSLLVTGGAVFLVSWYAPAQVQGAFAYLGVWFLLFGGVRPVFELRSKRRRGRARDSDADQLARLTPVPAVLWVGSFAILALAALIAGGRWLVAG